MEAKLKKAASKSVPTQIGKDFGTQLANLLLGESELAASSGFPASVLDAVEVVLSSIHTEVPLDDSRLTSECSCLTWLTQIKYRARRRI